MRNYIKPFFIAAIFSISPLMAYADEEIPIEGDPGNNGDEQGKKDRDYIEPPHCTYSEAGGTVAVSFDYYAGNATITIASLSSGETWSITASTMIQPIECRFGNAPGQYSVSITTTKGDAYIGYFTIM